MESNNNYELLKKKPYYKPMTIKGTMMNGNKTINQYEIIRVLGKGGFSIVKLGIRGHNRDKYALKIFDKEKLKKENRISKEGEDGIVYKDNFELVLNEVLILGNLEQKNIIKLIEAIDDPRYSELYLVLEFAANGQIIDFNKELEKYVIQDKNNKNEYLYEDKILDILRGTISGLNYLHKQGIMHRDLKPENILEDGEGNIKIADFSSSDKISDDNDTIFGFKGTFYFMSPESISNNDGYSGKANDIWSLGVCVFCYVYLKLPFFHENNEEFYNMIQFSEVVFPETPKISKKLKDIISQMLIKDPSNRITIEELKKNPFLGLKK